MQCSPTWPGPTQPLSAQRCNREGHALVTRNLGLAFSSVKWRFQITHSLCEPASFKHLSFSYTKLSNCSQHTFRIRKAVTAHIILPSWNVFHPYFYWKLISPFKIKFSYYRIFFHIFLKYHSANLFLPLPCSTRLLFHSMVQHCYLSILIQSRHVGYKHFIYRDNVFLSSFLNVTKFIICT